MFVSTSSSLAECRKRERERRNVIELGNRSLEQMTNDDDDDDHTLNWQKKAQRIFFLLSKLEKNREKGRKKKFPS
jgi:hypothetical protein